MGSPVMLADHCLTIQGITCWCGIQRYQASLSDKHRNTGYCKEWDGAHPGASALWRLRQRAHQFQVSPDYTVRPAGEA
ncbi:hypothetical protein I79_008376 [Cricetulus griseus]|uniref:Uncharacterized protein n=1 Tax=Cricetulus griseus TaxID=10029 RepID=G3HD05_CRIGR|nr:hypothetical protein I79_008376 [Cricetulus griseus]